MEILIDGNCKFEIVKSVPKGFIIWNIGKNMIDGYVPLCELLPEEQQPFKGGRTINPKTLKAIKFDKAQELLANVGAGHCDTLKECETYLKRKKLNSYTKAKCEKALPLLKQLIWD